MAAAHQEVLDGFHCMPSLNTIAPAAPTVGLQHLADTWLQGRQRTRMVQDHRQSRQHEHRGEPMATRTIDELFIAYAHIAGQFAVATNLI